MFLIITLILIALTTPGMLFFFFSFFHLFVLFYSFIFVHFFFPKRQARLAAAVFPGMVMCPVSSVLEASNAGHFNSESMTKRWTRGFVPRIGREVFFFFFF